MSENPLEAQRTSLLSLTPFLPSLPLELSKTPIESLAKDFGIRGEELNRLLGLDSSALVSLLPVEGTY
jgi:hypothetical protein